MTDSTSEADVHELCKHFSGDNLDNKRRSLSALMKRCQLSSYTDANTYVECFPHGMLNEILGSLFRTSDHFAELIENFSEYLRHDDVRFYAMKYILSNLRGSLELRYKLEDVFIFLQQLTLPQVTSSNEALKNLFIPSLMQNRSAKNKPKFVCINEHRNLFTLLWMEFLKQDLTREQYKAVLVLLPEKVMPFMSNPLILSDFLTQSYALGGPVSLLSLNGLFVLISKYNLNYPKFYEKLYALLQPEIFYVKFRARFFYLLDLFLTSTHLPLYLVAAFTKKLSRLSLTAPVDSLTSLVPFIYNLIIRHPNLKCLLHNPTPQQNPISCDPFVDTESDPSKCKALQSSLWELKCLEEHYYHGVVKDAEKCQKVLPAEEFDVSELLETTIEDLVKKKKVPTATLR